MGVAAKPRCVPAYPVVAYLPAEMGSWGGRGTTERPLLSGACIACVSGFAAEVPVRGPGGTSSYSRLVFVTPLWAGSLRQGLCLFRHFARYLCVDRLVVAGFGQMLSDGDCGSWKMNILEKWNVFLCRVIAAPVCAFAQDRRNARCFVAYLAQSMPYMTLNCIGAYGENLSNFLP